ncbi:hypothetical protein ACFL1B_03370 [Nanoarchaeota archaeon]
MDGLEFELLTATTDDQAVLLRKIERDLSEMNSRELWNKIVSVGQNEQAITHGDDLKPLLTTTGAGPCIVVSGYDKSSRVGFLTHYDNPKAPDSFEALFGELLPGNYEVKIDGGERYQDYYFIDRKTGKFLLKEKIDSLSSSTKTLRIVRDTAFSKGSNDESYNVLFDTRTGQEIPFPYKKLQDMLRHEPMREIPQFLATTIYNSFAA